MVLCEWISDKFKLTRLLPKSTFAEALKKPERANNGPIAGTRKSSHLARFPEHDLALVAWIKPSKSLELVLVTGVTITHKA
ncbi:hypothetical protein PybrP1_000359 [[Pythium] brassicae (nom. inval.)]|nr:hypothetical protein PybrP1_000359 [[Pythium] brassicae (nom. inval.)]